MNTRCAPRPTQFRTSLLVLALAAVAAGCTYPARRALTVASTPAVLEGQRAQVTVTVRNVFHEPIIPVSLSIYARREPTEYLAAPRTIAEVDYLKPVLAAEVRHLGTLNRIEAQQIRDGGVWRRVPHSRYLHPVHILLPGQAFTETFDCQARLSYRWVLYCDLYYFPLSSEQLQGHLYQRTTPEAPPPDADRYADVFARLDEAELTTIPNKPSHYLLHRPRLASAETPRLLRKHVPLRVRRRPFSYGDAVDRARPGVRDTCYFAAAGTWVFDYRDGTWFIGPVATTKLAGHYITLVADLERTAATALQLTAPRKPNDPFLELLQKAGYSDPAATTDPASAAIPLDALLSVLEQAEALGYTIDGTTWRPMR